MLTRVHSARAFFARGITTALFAAFTLTLIGLSSTTAWSEPKDIRWGTGPVGSVGHKALVVLADLLNKEMPDYRITVLPMPGAVMTVKGYATDQIDAYYGSDDALREFASDAGRFKGFKASIKRQPVQSMWMFTLDVGLAIKASNADKIKKWADLDRQEGLHRTAAVRHAPASRERHGGGRRQAHLRAGRPVHGRLAAQFRLHRRHDRLLHRRRRAGAVAVAGLARGRLGRRSIRARTNSPS